MALGIDVEKITAPFLVEMRRITERLDFLIDIQLEDKAHSNLTFRKPKSLEK